MDSVLLDVAGHRRSPATMPGYHRGRLPRNKLAVAGVGGVEVDDGQGDFFDAVEHRVLERDVGGVGDLGKTGGF
jgi:hypothetical protein